MKYCCLGISLLFFVVTIKAQEFKLGKLKKEHFNIELTKEQSEAPAVYLSKNRRTHFEYKDNLDGWLLYTTVHNVVKINNPDGFSYGTKKVRLYKEGRESEILKKVEAFSYNIKGGEVERLKIEKENIIERGVNRNLKEVSIVLPLVKVGTIIEYAYTIESSYWAIDDVILQEDIPVRDAFAKIEIPQFFDYNTFVKGYLNIKPKRYTELRNENFSREQKNPFGGRTNRTLFANMKYEEAVTEYKLKNIAAIQEEEFVNNMNNYRASIIYELAAVEFAIGKREGRAKTWDEVSKFINTRLKAQIASTNFLDEVAKELKEKSNSYWDRVYNTYAYIQREMTWDKNENIYRSQDIKKAYKEKKGSAFEVNLLLVSLLKKMGLNAAPVMASTKRHGVPIYPTVSGFDYVLAAVVYNDEWLLLDATGKNLYPGLIPERIMNWEGRLIKENGASQAISLFSKKYAENKSMMIATIDSKGSISGNCRQRYSNNEGLYMRDTFIGLTPDQQQAVFKDFVDIETVENIKFSLEDLSKPVSISFAFNTDKYIEIIDGKLYISPQLFLEKSQNPFKKQDRKLPIDFRFPRAVENSITLSIPEGYQIESIPEAIDIQVPDGLGSYKIVFKQLNETSIQLLSSFKMNITLVEAAVYNDIKNFYAEIVAKEKEKVVLVKK